MMEKAPPLLQQIQAEFSQSMRTQLDILPTGYRCRVEEYSPFIVQSMVPRQAKTGIETLSIYNEQYWFRLLTVLQEEMPVMRHLLGIKEFNRFASR